MNPSDIATRAEQLFEEGLACSEAVMLAVGDEIVPDFDRSLIKLATPWAGGIAYGGSVCGSMAGGLMIIGLLHGRVSTDASSKPALALARKFRTRFDAEFGSLLCGDITGGKFHRAGDRCRRTIRFTVETLLELLAEEGSGALPENS